MAKTFQHKPNSGSLFPNNKTKDTQPDLTGIICLADGTEKRISAWKKTGMKGEFYSISISDLQEARREVSTADNNSTSINPVSHDDLPF